MRTNVLNDSLRAARKMLAAAALAAALLVGSPACVKGADAKPGDMKKVDEAVPAKAATPKQPRKVLVYGLAQGFVHSSIPLGQYAVAKMGEKSGAYASVVSNDPSMFDAEKLKDFDVVVLVSTTGRYLLPRGPEVKKPDTKGMSPEEKKAAEEAANKAAEPAKKAFEESIKPHKDAEKQRLQNLIEFVRGGKGLMGIHAATDAYYDQKDYGEMIGGYFTSHPWGKGMVYKIDDPSSPLTAMFPKDEQFKIDDETYKFKSPYSREMLRVVVSMENEKSKVQDKDARPDKDHAVSWVREFGKGRVFYASHGHSEHVYWNPVMLQHYLAGIQYAAGDISADATPNGKGASAAK